MITGTEIKTWHECPMKANYQHVLRRAPHTINDNLQIGTIWHVAAEARVDGKDWKEAIAPLLEQSSLKVHKEWLKLEHLIPNLIDAFPPGLKILATELPLKAQIDYWEEYGGRLDHLAEFEGGLWDVQYKTIAYNQNINNLIANLRDGTHEVMYHDLAQRAYPERTFLGTIAVIAKKITDKAFNADQRPQQLWVERIPRSLDFVRSRFHRDIFPIMRTIQEETPWRNSEACYRFGACPYIPVCWEGADINDDTLYRTTEDRYADLNGEEE